MGLPAERPVVVDPGLDETAKKLSREKIRETIKSLIDKETAARHKVYLQTCVHCGLCAGACHYSLSHDKDPSYAPVGKVRQTLWEMIRRDGDVDAE